MDRAEFLSRFWNRYPAVKKNALDVSGAFSFLGSENLVRVGGRLFGSKGHWTLNSGGSACVIQFDQSCKWIEATTSFDETLLATNDIVLVKARVTGSIDSPKLHVLEIQLLAPSFADAKHNTSAEVGLLHQWSDFVFLLRQFFRGHGFLEMQTPTLVPSPGTEPYLDVFTTEFVLGRTTRQYFLPTSPEFHLKKLISRGYTKIFEIRNCFRNGEVSDHHQPEFQMLEWYRAYAGLDSIIEDIQNLLKFLQTQYPEKKIPDLRVITMAKLFQDHCGGFILKPDSSKEELFVLCKDLNLNPADDDSWDDLFFRIIIEKIEPSLDKETPTIVRNYPKPQAALARLNKDSWAERFEFYWQGLEIANAFDELNDPQQNEQRFKSDLEKRLASGRTKHPLDDELITNFYAGMPPAGGIALGVERLFMALTGITDITQIKPFAIKP